MLHLTRPLQPHTLRSPEVLFTLEWSANSCEHPRPFTAPMVLRSSSNSTDSSVRALRRACEHPLWTFTPKYVRNYVICRFRRQDSCVFISSCAASRNHRVQDKCNKTTMCSSLGPTTKPARDFQGVSLSNKTQGNQRGDLVLKRLENTHLVWLRRLTLDLAEL